jgi:hypothetical protein
MRACEYNLLWLEFDKSLFLDLDCRTYMNLVLELFEEIYNIKITVGNYSLARD